MRKYKIVISDYYYPDQVEENKIYAKLGCNVQILDLTKLFPGGIKKAEELIPYIRDCDALVVQFAEVTAEVIQNMEKCKIIARYAIGVDNIDVKTATEEGIYVANVPDYCIDEVANTAIAHLMNGMRKILTARDMLIRNEFQINAIYPMKRMKNSVLSLLGFGNIARNVAEKMKTFVGKILVYDPYFTDRADYPYIQFVELKDALSKGDMISVHIPLNDSTRGILNKRNLSLIKEDAVLVNTARGGLLEEDALLDLLKDEKIGYCGLDVINTEDFADSPFLHQERVALTPHIAWCSEEAIVELQQKVAENVVSTLLTGKPVYCVNFNNF